MSISSTTSRNDYTGNGAVDTYAYGFRIFDEDHLLVTVRDTDDVETTLVINTDYTVTGVNAAAGGNVVLVDNNQDWIDADGDLASGFILSIRRVVPLKQETDIRNQGSFLPETHEDQMDRHTMADQQQQDEIDRALKTPESIAAADFDPTLPGDLLENGADRCVTVNADGDGIALAEDWPTVGAINGAAAAATAAIAAQAAAEAAQAAAETAETNAELAETHAETAETNAETAETNAETAETNAAASASSASTSATTATTQATNAAASAASASTSATTATTQASNASTSATNAATSASSASTSASSASTSASSASTSATNAAASASAAAATLASALWRGMLRKTSADSPYTVTSADNGKLLVCDTSSGAITINLPQVSGLTLPFNVGVQLDAGSVNAITINRAGTDTIDGATSKTLSVAGSGCELLADSTPAPDEWEVLDFGSQAGNLSVDRFNGDNSTVAFVLSVDPGSENNTWVYVSGVYQQKNTYSVSGTTLTFSTAPPTGTNNVEVVIGTTISIGVPSDATVSNAKLATTAITGQTADSSPDQTADYVLTYDASAGTLKKVLLRDIAVPAGSVVQIARADLATSGTGTTDMVWDDTIPQNTEGDEILTCAITPRYSNSKLIVQAQGFFGEDATSSVAIIMIALFRDTTANAIAAIGCAHTTNGEMGANFDHAPLAVSVQVDASSTSATTFKLRGGLAGAGATGTFRWNGVNTARKLGGALITSITVTEIKQ